MSNVSGIWRSRKTPGIWRSRVAVDHEEPGGAARGPGANSTFLDCRHAAMGLTRGRVAAVASREWSVSLWEEE